MVTEDKDGITVNWDGEYLSHVPKIALKDVNATFKGCNTQLSRSIRVQAQAADEYVRFRQQADEWLIKRRKADA